MARALLSLMQKRLNTLAPSRLSSASPKPITTASSSSKSSFTVEYLINSCGFSSKSAFSVSRKFQLDENNLHKPESVLQFLKAHDFSDTHIVKLIQKTPRVLHSSVEKNLRPKFNFLIEIGFVGELLPDLIALDPHILGRSLESHLKVCFEFLRPFFDSNEKFGATVFRCSWLLSSSLASNIEANIDFLIKEGVPASSVGKLLMLHPRHLLQRHEKMLYAVNTVKNLGLQSKASMFVNAVAVVLQLSESTWKKKMEMMKSLGWSEDETLLAFKRYPYFMGCSEEKIKKAMDFYTNIIKLERKDIVTNPVFLMLSLDKRVRPRWNLLQTLKSNNLMKRDVKMKAALQMSEKLFVQRYVTRYMDKVSNILEIYGGACTAER